jgi:hypothetical protein
MPKGDLGPDPENLSGSRVSSHSIERRVRCLTDIEELSRRALDTIPRRLKRHLGRW